jgi:hypothetical protein
LAIAYVIASTTSRTVGRAPRPTRCCRQDLQPQGAPRAVRAIGSGGADPAAGAAHQDELVVQDPWLIARSS